MLDQSLNSVEGLILSSIYLLIAHKLLETFYFNNSRDIKLHIVKTVLNILSLQMSAFSFTLKDIDAILFQIERLIDLNKFEIAICNNSYFSQLTPQEALNDILLEIRTACSNYV